MYSPKRQKGNMAEDIAMSFIKKNGFTVVERNYAKKWGEIDIIAEKYGKIHFLEVKSSFVSAPETNIFKKNDLFEWKVVVSHETGVPHETENYFDPVWNMTNKKKASLSKIIRTYLYEKCKEKIPDFQIDLLSVSLDYLQKTAYISEIENILLE